MKRLNLFLGKTFFKFLISFSNVKIIYSGKTKTTSHGFLHLPYSSSHFLRCIRFITPIRRKFRVGSGVGGEQTSWLAQLKYDLCGFLSKAVLGEKNQKQTSGDEIFKTYLKLRLAEALHSQLSFKKILNMYKQSRTTPQLNSSIRNFYTVKKRNQFDLLQWICPMPK